MKKILNFIFTAICILIGSISQVWSATYTVTDSADAGAGTLRDTVSQANASVGIVDTIQFALSNTITVYSEIVVSDPLIIDGQGQTISSTGSASNAILNLDVGSDGSTITGVALVNASNGIVLNSHCNRIYGCRIGTDWSDAAGIGNGNGIYVSGHFNDIGGSTSGKRNIISGNDDSGVHLENAGPGVVGTTIRGNYIGVDSGGSMGLPNTNGILSTMAIASRIGGNRLLNDGEGNVISGNNQYGVYIQEATSFGNTICGNVIGISANQDAWVGNQSTGINIKGSSGNYIGIPLQGYENVIGGHYTSGISIDADAITGEPKPVGNIVQNNFVGCTTGETPSSFRNGSYGIIVQRGYGNQIGGDINTYERNVVSGNSPSSNGIWLGGWNNKVCGNYIGTNDGGTMPIPNRTGMTVAGYGHLIGGINGTDLIEGNVISGNEWGVYIGFTVTGGNTVTGNYIGTNRAGSATLGTQEYGVYVNADNNLIGGDSPFLRNVIVGHSNSGICIDRSEYVVIKGNYIGVAADGLNRLSNNRGIALVAANNTIVGGTVGTDENIICSSFTGIMVGSSWGNSIVGNKIGVFADGSIQQLSSGHGIWSHGGFENYIGYSGAGSGNLISGWENGIYMSSSSRQNGVFGNTITAFNSSGIQLEPGTNGDKIAPAISHADATASVYGTAQANDYIEIYLAEKPGGNGGSIRFIGSTTANGSGDWSLPVSGLLLAGDYVCATATDGNNNTSEFSDNVLVLPVVTVTVSPTISTTPTITMTSTITLTATITPTSTISPTFTISQTSSISPTITRTPTITLTSTITPTNTISPTITKTATSTYSPTVTPTLAIGKVDLRGKQVLAFPNPARGKVRFLFHLEQASKVKISIYNLTGDRVAMLYKEFTAGRGLTLAWDCGAIAPGIYLASYQLNGEVKETIKIAIVE